jgi:hypothetical protein
MMQLTTTQKKGVYSDEDREIERQVGKSLKDYPEIDLPNDSLCRKITCSTFPKSLTILRLKN